MPRLELYSVRDGEVPKHSGLNWCFANAHVKPEDAYIALTIPFFKNNPDFFPKVGSIINVKWDDGVEMHCLLEATQTINGIVYPKQLSTYNEKSELGHYLRQRLGVNASHVITLNDLNNYGRNYIDVICITKHRDYYFDFHI
ncbi:MAG: NgoFVII family restriction endonuclease [Ruminococcus flavefaciens]|nr:NgoFVII family restriction endonuclease [Ruminococcus flavefaciens]